MENVYYEVIYNLLREPRDHARKATILKHMKSKITRLHHEQQKRLFLKNADRGRIDDNSPSSYHLIWARKWQERRTVQTIQDRNGVTHTTMADTKHTFKDYMHTKFDIIPADGESLRRLMQNVTRALPQDAAKALDTPITKDELRCAVQKGKSNKTRGEYGIVQEFFIEMWETIIYDLIEIVNQMYIDGMIYDNKKHGLIVCVPKKLRSTRPEDFRHMTLSKVKCSEVK